MGLTPTRGSASVRGSNNIWASFSPSQLTTVMQFEVLSTCHTTRARVSRMKLARELRVPTFVNVWHTQIISLDGVTLLPTFMPVATQAAIKGLTPQQMEGLGVTLILNNTYHLNLRPGIKVLREAGGAHRLQGWNHNLLTVRDILI
jgi:queuine tRNA-ribosyltransferase